MTRPLALAFVAAIAPHCVAIAQAPPVDRLAALLIPKANEAPTGPHCRLPEFPPELARVIRGRFRGTTSLEFQASAEGKLLSVAVLQSAGHPDFDDEVIQSLSGCPVRPALRDGVPVDGRFRVDYVWIVK